MKTQANIFLENGRSLAGTFCAVDWQFRSALHLNLNIQHFVSDRRRAFCNQHPGAKPREEALHTAHPMEVIDLTHSKKGEGAHYDKPSSVSCHSCKLYTYGCVYAIRITHK